MSIDWFLLGSICTHNDFLKKTLIYLVLPRPRRGIFENPEFLRNLKFLKTYSFPKPRVFKNLDFSKKIEFPKKLSFENLEFLKKLEFLRSGEVHCGVRFSKPNLENQTYHTNPNKPYLLNLLPKPLKTK